jgi:signal transduction histidine kinase
MTLDTVGEPGTVPVAVELAAYRIVQEALTNVIRHAHAESATVRVEYLRDALLVRITDDGRGATGSTNGHGMIGMRERARAVGGTFEAGTADRGFVVSARLPLGGAR